VGLGKKVIYTPSKGGKGHVSAYGFTKKDAEPRRNARRSIASADSTDNP